MEKNIDPKQPAQTKKHPGQATDSQTSKVQPKNPLHGITLEQIVTQLEAHFGWEELGQRITIRCFNSDPSIKSSLTFLRKTPWARTQVEALYLEIANSPYNKSKNKSQKHES